MPYCGLKQITLLLLVSLFSLSGCAAKIDSRANNNDRAKAKLVSENADNRLNVIKERGSLICGVNGQLPGFSSVNDNGNYSGMDVDLCRAVASALFDDPNAVEFRNLNAEERFTALQTGEIDLLSRNTTWTLSRDAVDGMDFTPITFYDGQGLLVSQDSEIRSLEDLDRKRVCVVSGTTTQQNLAEQMQKHDLSYVPVIFEDADRLYIAYERGDCEVATGDRSQLISRRATLKNPEQHQVLNLVLSKEPLSPVVADGQPEWFDVVKWVTYATIKAEELGVNSQNVNSFTRTDNPQIQRFLGMEGNLGRDMGLSPDFAKRAIEQVGNYGEIYERNIGKPYGLPRGVNALWKNGGLMYAPPFR